MTWIIVWGIAMAMTQCFIWESLVLSNSNLELLSAPCFSLFIARLIHFYHCSLQPYQKPTIYPSKEIKNILIAVQYFSSKYTKSARSLSIGVYCSVLSCTFDITPTPSIWL